MSIKGHVFEGSDRKYWVHTFGTLVPSYVVLHFTLGGTVSSSVKHLNKNEFGYNIIVDRDGRIYQTAPFNRIVRHAGASNWRGWDNLNSFSIGICFASYGPCYLKNGRYVNHYGGRMDPNEVVAGSHYNGVSKYQGIFWEEFPTKQIESGLKVTKAIVGAYQIRDVIRHDDVAIARKIDTGPALDLTPFRALVGDLSGEKIYRFRVVVPAGDTLSLRSSYSPNSNKIGSFSGGTELYVHSFAYRYYNKKPVKTKWCAVSQNGLDRIGFVNSHYLEAIGNFV